MAERTCHGGSHGGAWLQGTVRQPAAPGGSHERHSHRASGFPVVGVNSPTYSPQSRAFMAAASRALVWRWWRRYFR
jgi:hypothetical protein